MGSILSVLIENSDMRICEISKSGSAITVKNAFQAELPSGVVDDGVLIDVEAVARSTILNVEKSHLLLLQERSQIRK